MLSTRNKLSYLLSTQERKSSLRNCNLNNTDIEETSKVNTKKCIRRPTFTLG